MEKEIAVYKAKVFKFEQLSRKPTQSTLGLRLRFVKLKINLMLYMRNVLRCSANLKKRLVLNL